jgi:hypothetical protein
MLRYAYIACLVDFQNVILSDGIYMNVIYTHKKNGKRSTELCADFYVDVQRNGAVIVEMTERSSF